MSFATPAPDMSNREICALNVCSGRRGGRPKRGAKDTIQSIAWYNFVRLALGKETAGAVAAVVQAHFDGLGMTTNHAMSKRWYRYRDGLETPNVQTLQGVDLIAPGSAEFFEVGPFELWLSIWSDRRPIWNDEFAELLVSAPPEAMNFEWLARLIATWSERAELARSGTATRLVDGFYEAVHLALNLPEIKKPLEQLGVWSVMLQFVTDRESENLRHDREKVCEIRAVGAQLGLVTPVDFYLDDPVGFLRATFAVSSIE